MRRVWRTRVVPSWTYANPLPDEKRVDKTTAEAVKDLLKAFDGYEKESVKVVSQRATKSDVGEGYYLYAEFTTKTFGFVDDVEFVRPAPVTHLARAPLPPRERYGRPTPH